MAIFNTPSPIQNFVIFDTSPYTILAFWGRQNTYLIFETTFKTFAFFKPHRFFFIFRDLQTHLWNFGTPIQHVFSFWSPIQSFWSSLSIIKIKPLIQKWPRIPHTPRIQKLPKYYPLYKYCLNLRPTYQNHLNFILL